MTIVWWTPLPTFPSSTVRHLIQPFNQLLILVMSQETLSNQYVFR